MLLAWRYNEIFWMSFKNANIPPMSPLQMLYEWWQHMATITGTTTCWHLSGPFRILSPIPTSHTTPMVVAQYPTWLWPLAILGHFGYCRSTPSLLGHYHTIRWSNRVSQKFHGSTGHSRLRTCTSCSSAESQEQSPPLSASPQATTPVVILLRTTCVRARGGLLIWWL